MEKDTMSTGMAAIDWRLQFFVGGIVASLCLATFGLIVILEGELFRQLEWWQAGELGALCGMAYGLAVSAYLTQNDPNIHEVEDDR